MKALVDAFNQEKALVGAFSMIVKTGCGTDGSFYSTNMDTVLTLVSCSTALLCPSPIKQQIFSGVAGPGPTIPIKCEWNVQCKEVLIKCGY